MDIRNVQRTGDMHYIYLPTAWCKEHHVTSKTKVTVDQDSEGSLIISPRLAEKQPQHLKFNISEDNIEIIHKLIVASYINPVSSFEINFDKKLDISKLLQQKRLISLESVEIDQNQITCDGAASVRDPGSLLKTMVKKIRNLVLVMQSNYDQELIEKYEEEIDRSKMLIDKSIITTLTIGGNTGLKTIDLYYISLIARMLERIVDRVITVKKHEVTYLSNLGKPLDILQKIVDDVSKLDQALAFSFAKSVSAIKQIAVKDVRTYTLARINNNLVNLSEVVMDWMVTLSIKN